TIKDSSMRLTNLSKENATINTPRRFGFGCDVTRIGLQFGQIPRVAAPYVFEEKLDQPIGQETHERDDGEGDEHPVGLTQQGRLLEQCSDAVLRRKELGGYNSHECRRYTQTDPGRDVRDS